MDPVSVLASALGQGFAHFAMTRRSKTRRENVHKHPIRKALLESIAANPGSNIHELSRMTGVPKSTIQYHLYILSRSSAIVSKEDGRDHRYFMPGTGDQNQERIAVLRRGRIGLVIDSIRSHPGCVQKEILAEVGLSRRVFREYANLLQVEGLLNETRDGPNRRYFPTPSLEKTLADLRAEQPQGPVQQTVEPSPELSAEAPPHLK